MESPKKIANLLVDIGNTRIKWAFWSPTETLRPLAVVHKGANLNKLFSEVWGNISSPPQAIYVSNVAGPTVAEALKKWVETRWKIPIHFLVSEKERAGIKNGYTKPEILGVDRWLAMLGARAHGSPPFCVIDCGSAITIDAVSGAGEHLGGLILPGLTRLQAALLEGCPVLVPPFAKNPPCPPFFKGGDKNGGLEPAPKTLLIRGGIFNKETFLAKNTQDGITQGIFFMITATFKQALKELKQRFGVSFTPIVTGGNAAYLLPYLPKESQHQPNLVLEGMLGLVTER